MARARSLEGREAGALAAVVQAIFRRIVGQALNPIKVQAHSNRIMLSSFLSNAILGSGRWTVGTDLVHLVRIRAAARNGCPFGMDMNAVVGSKEGQAEVRRSYETEFAVFPDGHCDLRMCTGNSGHGVAESLFRGTRPRSGEVVEAIGAEVLEIVDGKIKEIRDYHKPVNAKAAESGLQAGASR
jgi:hypothetical protein